jgi:hypothetical protein
MYVKKVLRAAGASPGSQVDDPGTLKKYPALLEYVASTVLEDGTARTPAKMSLSIQEGRWCVCFQDLDNKRIAFLTGETLDKLLASLEKKLAEDTLEWRAAKTWGKKSG